MDKWERLAEKKIREAFEEGEFDNLEGAGQPLHLDENPFEDPDLAMVRRLLRHNGFSLPWLKDRKELVRELASIRKELLRQVARFQEAGFRAGGRETILAHLKGVLSGSIEDLNRRIAKFNLKAPSTRFHPHSFDISRELERLFAGSTLPSP